MGQMVYSNYIQHFYGTIHNLTTLEMFDLDLLVYLINAQYVCEEAQFMRLNKDVNMVEEKINKMLMLFFFH